jgi:hypothetical protein
VPEHGACFLSGKQIHHLAYGRQRASGRMNGLECLFSGEKRMLLLKYLLLLSGAGLLGGTFAVVIYDVYRTRESWRQY